MVRVILSYYYDFLGIGKFAIHPAPPPILLAYYYHHKIKLERNWYTAVRFHFKATLHQDPSRLGTVEVVPRVQGNARLVVPGARTETLSRFGGLHGGLQWFASRSIMQRIHK